MPTILKVEGYRFFFYSNDHPPPHVHVEQGDAVGKWTLDPVEVVGTRDFTPGQARQAKLLIIRHRELFLERWHEFFKR